MDVSKLMWTMAISVMGGTMLGGCNWGNPKPVVMEVEAGGKVFLHLEKGDTVQWKGAGSAQLVVKFPIGSPCQGTSGPGGGWNTCTVQTDGVFPYTCDGCADPAVVVGSGGGPLTGAAQTLAGNPINAQAGYLFCDSGVPKAYPDPLVTADGETIQWFPAAGANLGAWQLTLQSGTCTETAVNQGQPVCTVQKNVPAGKQSYSITAPTCSPTPGTAWLTIQ
ncbi:MAG: hypothetical protein WBL61_09455 [Bryobacteraceae bacterium]